MIDKIQKIIKEGMGINSSKLSGSSQLGGTDIGLDSQEIIDFTCMIEKAFGVKFSSPLLTKISTLQEVVTRVQQMQDPSPRDSVLFEGRTEASIDMQCTAEAAYKAIYEMEKWPEKLPHVKRIETLYNDGIYQEFFMDVASETGLIQVRSIRRCTKDSILFFQPKPPKFLKHHSGGWSFIKKAEGCEVKTWHQWNLLQPQASEIFPCKEAQTSQDQIARTLKEHAQLALNTWKSILEKSL